MSAFKRKILEGRDDWRMAVSLGELCAAGRAVHFWCNRCRHSGALPSARLAGELGPAFPVAEVGARLRCAGCGSKDVATRADWSVETAGDVQLAATG